jgi:hypothetical protein
MRDIAGFQDRINRTRKVVQRRSGRAVDPTWYRLRASPSCPPSTTVRVRGGLVHNASFSEWAWSGPFGNDPYAQNYRAYTVPDLSIDVNSYIRYELGVYPALTPIEESVVFDTPGYYKCYVMLLNFPLIAQEPTDSDWSCHFWGTGTELATASEAEAHMEWDTMAESAPWGSWDTEPGFHGFPLCGLILRNDGTAGANHALPVDHINRGRSYLWPADVRPLWMFNR